MQRFVLLHWYDEAIEFVFRFVAKTSEPLLALGLVISAADFLSKGAIMQSHALLTLAWAWTQALAIEASSGVVFVYALHSFKQQDKLKAWLYLVLSVLLALTGGAMLFFQLIANTTGLQEQALPSLLFYAMAALRVIVSVSYVYLCRAKTIRFTDLADMSGVSEKASHPMLETSPVVSPEVLNVLIQRLDTLTVTQLTGGAAPALPEQAQSMQQHIQETMHLEQTHEHEQQEGHKQETPAVDEPLHAVYGKQCGDFGDTIEAIVAAHPHERLTVREVAALAGCSTRTADKWMKRLQLPHRENQGKKENSMSTEKGHTLVPSTKSGRYALDDPQDDDLTSGQTVDVLLGDGWTQGRVEHASRIYAIERTGQAERGYYFLAHNGTVCGLCAGMQARLR